jgi:hypothetical protein
MAYVYVEYQYPIAEQFNKELLWVDKNCNVYFAFKLTAADDWIFYSGNPNGNHALTSEGCLTPYGTDEASAISNYLTTTRDSNGKAIAPFSGDVYAKFARVYIEEGNDVTVYEWTPSVSITANDITTGEILISDMLSDNPSVRVVVSSVDRLILGKVGNNYGLFGYDENGNEIFELSDGQQTIGGWTFTEDTLSCGSGDNGIILDAGQSSIESRNYASGPLGSGFHIDPNLMEVGNASIRGVLQCIVFKKETINAVGGDLLIVDSDVLDDDMTVLDSSLLTIKGTSTFAVGDILRIKADAFNDEWLSVTDIASAPTYSVTRDRAGLYSSNHNPAWSKGSAVINYRQSGEGLIYLTASDGTTAPSISVITYGDAPWIEAVTRMRIGNLNGYLGYSDDVYGVGIGDTDQYLKYDPVNGLRIRGNITLIGGGAPGGTDWDDITNKPSSLGTPTGSGLFLSASHMGFYKDSAWQTYIDNAGNMSLGVISGENHGLSWNQATGILTVGGKVVATENIQDDSVTTKVYAVTAGSTRWIGASYTTIQSGAIVTPINGTTQITIATIVEYDGGGLAPPWTLRILRDSTVIYESFEIGFSRSSWWNYGAIPFSVTLLDSAVGTFTYYVQIKSADADSKIRASASSLLLLGIKK